MELKRRMMMIVRFASRSRLRSGRCQAEGERRPSQWIFFVARGGNEFPRSRVERIIERKHMHYESCTATLSMTKGRSLTSFVRRSWSAQVVGSKVGVVAGKRVDAVLQSSVSGQNLECWLRWASHPCIARYLVQHPEANHPQSTGANVVPIIGASSARNVRGAKPP
jgi:hypothetical protein